MTSLSLLRFFAVVLRVHITTAVVAVLLLGMAAWMARNDPQEIQQLCTLALFVQMFAAGSGFREPARRGHFDFVLTAGTSRRMVAVTHWAVSCAPGLVVWAALSLVTLWTRPDEPAIGLTASGLVAVLYVSTASWVMALPLTRYASGVVWLLVLFVLSGMTVVPTLRGVFLTSPASAGAVLRQAAAALVCPVFLVAGGDVAARASLAVIAATTVALAVTGGLVIGRLNAPLQDPS